MGRTEYYHKITAALPVALPAVLAGVLLLLAACGGDDASPTDDGSASPTAGGETLAPTGTVTTSPGGTADQPSECAIGDGQEGLLSTLQFDSDPAIYEPGDGVDMSLSLINCDDDAENLYYSTTQRYVFIIDEVPDPDALGAGGREVWRSSDGKTYEDTPGEEVIDRNETVVYTEIWDQTDTANDKVPEGFYRVSAFSVGCGAVDGTECRFGPIRYIEITSGGE